MNQFQSQMASYSGRYIDVNRKSMQWVLSRSSSTAWLNTKYHPIERRNYTTKDDLRGPEFQYNWIQGRGLEALIRHACFFKVSDPELSKKLMIRSSILYDALYDQFTKDGCASFCVDADQRAICTHPSLTGQKQLRDADIHTFSDMFVAKGLIAGSFYHHPERLPEHLHYLQKIIDAIENSRFLMDESSHLTDAALQAQPSDLGPRMIAIGAAGLLRQLNLADHDTFSTRFLYSILEHHTSAVSVIPTNAPDGAVTNPGHVIELVGLYLEAWGKGVPDHLVLTLRELLLQTFELGFNGAGIALGVNVQSRLPTTGRCPWWSLPEAIRAAAMLYRLGSDERVAALWQRAHQAFFQYYWQDEPPVAYQMCEAGLPVDHVPATPDLDPGYHTGLSLLAAIEVATEGTETPISPPVV